MTGNLLGGQVGLDLQARQTAGTPFSGRVEVRELALGWLLTRFGVPEAAGASGIATGVIHIDRGLLARPETIEGHLALSMLRVAVNEEFREWGAPLAANDRIVFIPPVAGG